jgi:hypothetical protein
MVSTYITSLDEVASNEKILLIRGELDVVGSDDGLSLIGVVEALGVAEVGDVEGGDVVSNGDGEVGELPVVGDFGVNGGGGLGLGAEIVEEFGNALLAIGVFAEGVDDPDLTGANSAIGLLD